LARWEIKRVLAFSAPRQNRKTKQNNAQVQHWSRIATVMWRFHVRRSGSCATGMARNKISMGREICSSVN
jgi:hypothetical protein